MVPSERVVDTLDKIRCENNGVKRENDLIVLAGKIHHVGEKSEGILT